MSMLCLYNLETPMRDGVLLRGDLYRPAEAGAYPLLLWRTIFRKNTLGRAFGAFDPAYFVRGGYAVFIQDARGLGESDGEFDRFTADGPDGYDTIEWLARQDFCDGNVGMIGNYYAGYLQLMAAAERPEHLRAICPMQTSVSINRDCDNRGFLFASHVAWCMCRQISRLRDGRYDEETTRRWLPKLLALLRSGPFDQLKAFPWSDMPAVKDTPFPLLRDYFRHLVDGYDDFELLHKEGRDMDLGRIDTPAFYVSGWYDSSRNALIDHCRAQRAHGVDSRLLIAPWKPGEAPAAADSALETGEHAVDMQAELLSWFDCWLKGAPKPDEKPYRYYDIVTDEPWTADEWTDDTNARWYLRADEALDASAAASSESPDAYPLDPLRPLPYVGYGFAAQAAPDGTLRYLTPPLGSDCAIRGMARAKVYLSSDAKDTDVVMRLCDVSPDGHVFVLCDGATRARYRNGWTSEPLKPDQVYPVDVLLGRVCYTVARGHRLMLVIAGTAFPKYDVNHGTADRPARDTNFVAAHNWIHHSAEHASCLMLARA